MRQARKKKNCELLHGSFKHKCCPFVEYISPTYVDMNKARFVITNEYNQDLY